MIGLLAAIVMLAAFAYIPGYLMMRAFAASRLCSFGFAPVVSTFLYVVFGVVLYNLGMFASWQFMVVPIFAFSLCAYLLSIVLRGGARWAGPRKAAQVADAARAGWVVCPPSVSASAFSCRINVRLLLFAVAFNLCLGAIVYLGTLSGPDSFSQNYDTAHHLSQIAATVQYGNWSTFNVSMDGAGSGVFYPSVLHIYAALLSDCLSVTSACAINAVVFLFVSLVFPVGVYLLGSVILPGHRLAGFCCCILALVFPALPWTLIRFSALLANVVGISFLPLALMVFVECFERGIPLASRMLRVLLCLVALFVISVAHPNTLFSAVVFLIPFCAQKVWDLFRDFVPSFKGKRLAGVVVVAVFLLACAFIWKSIHGLEYIRPIVEFEYRSFSSVPQAIADIAMMKFRWFSPNIPLAALVLGGVFVALKSKGCRWMVATYLFGAVQLVVCTSQEPCALKSFLCGFWYNHDFRLMASFCMCALPLAGLGLSALAGWMESILAACKVGAGSDAETGNLEGEGQPPMRRSMWQRFGDFTMCKLGVSGPGVLTVAIAVVLVCFPVGYSFSEGVGTRSLGQVMAKLYAINDWDGDKAIYRSEEREFVKQAVRVLPGDAVVMNFPYDGSSYAYGLDGLRTYFKSNVTAIQSDAEYIVETRLHDLAWDPEVQAAVKELGITHVIQLDHGLGSGSSTLEREYHREKWTGICSLSEKTDGFEEILANDDCRLYRIVYIE